MIAEITKSQPLFLQVGHLSDAGTVAQEQTSMAKRK
jgi:hypothetical protein